MKQCTWALCFLLLITALGQAQSSLTVRLSQKRVAALLDRRLPPADLLAEIWPQIPASEKPPAIVAKTAWYTDTPGEFCIAYAAVGKSDTDELRSMSCFWQFQYRGGRIVRIGGAGSKSIDRIDGEATCWCNWDAAYLSPSDPQLTQQLYRQLQLIRTQPGLIRLRPTKGRLPGSRYAREDERNIAQLQQVLQEWQSTPPAYAGITKSPFDVMLWCDDGLSLWGFEWRLSGGQWTLADWEQLSSNPGVPTARARLCTIPIASLIESPSERIGGAGTSVPLTQLGQPGIGQLLIRLVHLGALNNQNEVFGYLDQSIDQPTRAGWWPMFRESMTQLKDLKEISVTTLSNGQIVMSYPTANGNQAIRCLLPTQNRLIVIAVRTTSISLSRSNDDSNTLLARATLLRTRLDRILVAARNGNATAFIAPGTTQDRINGLLLQWVQDSAQTWYGSKVFEANGPLVVIEQRAGQYRIAIAYFTNNREPLLSNLWVQSWISKQRADDILRSAQWPFGP